MALAAIAIGGCGKEEEAPKALPLLITVKETSAHRFSYSAPRSIPAGLVRMTLENKGKKPHKAQLFRVLDGHSVRDALRARRLPKWLISAGGVRVTAPGARASATQRLAPGTYYIAGSGRERGWPAPLRVIGEEGDGGLPRTNASIVTREYNFTPSGLKAGTNSIEIRNEGLEPHHTVIAPVKPGTSVTKLRRFLSGRAKIPIGDVADVDAATETAVLEEGQKQVLTLRLPRGEYALLCFVPDRGGGPAHVVKGMVDQVTVR